MTARTKITLRALVSLALLSAIIAHIDWREIAAIALSIELWPVGVTILLNAAGVALSVVKWRWFLDLHQIHVGFGRLHLLYYVGFFFNNFLPTMVGGDALRVLNTAQGSRYAEALAAVMGERGTGFGTMLLLAGTAGLINLQRDVPVGLDWLTVIVFVACAGGLAVVLLSVALRRQQLSSMWARRFGKVSDAVVDCLRSPTILGKALLVSLLFHIMLVTNAWLFCYAIGLHIDFLALAVIFPVAMLAAMLPVSLNGLGVKEGALIVLLGQVGVTPEQALIVAVLSRLFVLVASVIGGLVFAVNNSVRISLIREPAATQTAANEAVR